MAAALSAFRSSPLPISARVLNLARSVRPRSYDGCAYILRVVEKRILQTRLERMRSDEDVTAQEHEMRVEVEVRARCEEPRDECAGQRLGVNDEW